MEIFKEEKYNQSVGKFKLLSSAAGVGSIITTKTGFFIMPQSVSFWGFIKQVNNTIKNAEGSLTVAQISKRSGVDAIDDSRFIEFLKKEQKIVNLKILVNIPHLTLDNWNGPEEKKHPLFNKFKNENNGLELKANHFTVPAIHFPRWFHRKSETLDFKPLLEWQKIWQDKRCNEGDLQYFVPPRDPFSKTTRKYKDFNKTVDEYELLVQVPIVLICKNGHISDIPWDKLFAAGLENGGRLQSLSSEEGFDLFNYNDIPCTCGGKHELQWLESRTSSESWGTLKCKKCQKTVSLEGIMNIKPLCIGETPWNGIGTHDPSCRDALNRPGIMQMALVTSNSIYYSDSFSSLFIPSDYLPTLSPLQQEVLHLLETIWYKDELDENPNLSKKDFWDNSLIKRYSRFAGKNISDDDLVNIKLKFLESDLEIKDTHEAYRFEEYKVFSEHKESLPNDSKLIFKDIKIPNSLAPYFKKIQQIESLAITLTQLDFYRVSFPSPKWIDGKVEYEEGQRIYKEPVSEVFALPANQSMGEGIFFEFDLKKVNKWAIRINELTTRYNQFKGDVGKDIKAEIEQYGVPQFYLLHTFSHLIIKELEFSCGYPSASLQERLYYSDRMCGVLIYTADGEDGSMGGLVWQGQPLLIEKIILSALHRAEECASDPLCWENEGNMNLAACFSCALISETSCEKRNLGLDRRALIDENWGYFKGLINS